MSSNKISGTGSSGSNSNSSSTHVLDNPLGYITNKLAIAAYASKEGVNVDGVMNVLSAEVDSQLLMIVQDAAKKAIHSRSGINLQHTNASEISLSSSSLSNDERYSNKNIYCNIQLRHLLWALVEPGDNNKSNNNGSANNNNNGNNNNSGSGSSSGGSSSNISTSVGNNNNNNNNSSSSSGSGNISIIRRPVPYAPNLNKYIRTQDVAQSNNGINDKISTSNQLTGFGRGRSDASIFFLKEPDVSIAELLSAATPSNAMNTSTSSMKTQGKALRISNKPPVSPGFRIHWLVVDGKQPSVPENPTQREIESMLKKDISLKRQRDNSIASVNRYGHSGNSNEGAITQPFGESIQARIIRNNPLLSKEHQIYFEKITSILETGQMQSNSSNNSSNESNSGSFQNENPLINSAIVSLANDAGLDGVVPHLVSFISEKVKSSFRSLRDLYVCMRASRALISNKNIKIDLYLHDLIPVIITCLVAKRLDDSADEDHWGLREYVAGVIRDACRIHGVSYPNLRPRILETLHGALSSMNKPLPTCYGAIVGIASLGPIAVESQLLPLVPSIVDRLDKYPKGSSKAIEAQYVLNALQRAVGVFFNYKISQRILMNQTYGSAFSPIDLENIAMELSEPLHPFVSLVMWNESSNFLDLSL